MLRLSPHRWRPATRGLVTLLALVGCVWAANLPVRAQQVGQLYISILDADNKPVTDLELEVGHRFVVGIQNADIELPDLLRPDRQVGGPHAADKGEERHQTSSGRSPSVRTQAEHPNPLQRFERQASNWELGARSWKL